jgi:predicted RNA binding protein YcfA (HicA-like mRNA interferase family)
MKDSEEIIRRLEKEGWIEVSRKGSHVTFKKDGVRNLITVPHPRRSLGKSLKRAIARAAGWK